MTDHVERNPLVSCIVIFFNAGDLFFREAIESILAQTYSHWELFLVDDGSTDGSTSIALDYVQNNPQKIYYLEHKAHQNKGMSATRNLGIYHAKGEYIAFLDADDLWLPHKLEQQVNLLEKYPEAAMLYGRTQFWFSWTTCNPCRSIFSLAQDSADPMTITSIKFDTIIQPPTQLILYLQDRNIYPCSCSMMVRSSTFEDIGGFEENFRNANEDMVFHSKVFLKFPVYVSSECWDRYRIHPNSYWRTAWRQGKGHEAEQVGRFNYLNWLNSYLADQGVQDSIIWEELNQAFFPYRHPRLFQLVISIQYPLVLLRQTYRKAKRFLKSILG